VEGKEGRRDAVLLPLETYVKDRNARAPYYKKRAGYKLFAEEMDLSYRSLSLQKWELKGPPETWRGQLEAYYKKGPVFALLGGIVGSWSLSNSAAEPDTLHLSNHG
jgi:hypothetical protein